MELHFEIENRCLLKCRHCSSCATNTGEGKKYSKEDIKKFLLLFSEEKNIFFTGGEPLIHQEIEEILLLLKNEVKNVCVGFFTTGIVEKNGELCSISKEDAKKLSMLGLRVCYFSIYSWCSIEHDEMTGINGSFELSLESIKNLVQQGVEVRINLVVTKKNFNKLDEIIKLLLMLKCSEVRLLKLIRHGRACECWEDIGLTEEEYQAVVLEAIKKYKNIRITASGCPEILPCRPFGEAKGCQAGSKLAYITYEGEVYPCASTKNNKSLEIGKIGEIEKLQNYFVNNNYNNLKVFCKKMYKFICE